MAQDLIADQDIGKKCRDLRWEVERFFAATIQKGEGRVAIVLNDYGV